MTHANAPLTPTGRLRLAKVIVEDGWSVHRDGVLVLRCTEQAGTQVLTLDHEPTALVPGGPYVQVIAVP